MAAIRLIAVGKPKEPFFRDAAEHYLARLAGFFSVELTEVKDAPGRLPPGERARREGKAILSRLERRDRLVGLDERGEAFSSRALAGRLARWTEDANFRPCFVIGGAYGLSEEVRAAAYGLVSLGPLTLPHELARVVLLEQLYRAATIIRGLPYHHG
jgi:23S rRNA (pseudouridine1915-N3)-methyltransferase